MAEGNLEVGGDVQPNTSRLEAVYGYTTGAQQQASPSHYGFGDPLHLGWRLCTGEAPVWHRAVPVALVDLGNGDLTLVRPLYDTERSQWLSEELEPGVNSIHLQPDQAGHGMLTGRQHQQQHPCSKPDKD